MITFKGISASPGIAMGEAYLYLEDTVNIPKYFISDKEIEDEILRYQRAVKRASDEITDIKNNLEEEALEEHQMLESHLLMLYDPVFKDQIFDSVRDVLKNVEWVLSDQITELVNRLKASQDLYLQERTSDIKDVSKRVIDHLMYKKKKSLQDIPKAAVIVTSDLRPSDTFNMNRELVQAIVMDEGGRTSHTAILARSFGIPAVLGLGDITTKVRAYDMVIVDGFKGIVIVHPDKKTEEHYREQMKQQKKREKMLFHLKKLPAQTTDGKSITLKANIEVPEDVEQALNYKAEGVGLFRSEFLFMNPEIIPTEELQYNAYSRVVEAMKDYTVTIRTLDVGGDKLIKEIEYAREKNPLLGWRAIRFCLDRKELFKTQLRALLRASSLGNLRIMFPLISCLEELNDALEILEQVKQELRDKKIPFDEGIKIGIMIEVPSAAMVSDMLAERCDFFSIGTNDLIQYSMAIDRGNEKVANLYNPFHPAIIRLLKMTVQNGHKAEIPVSMCGEMAGDPKAAALLLALGLDELSMNCYSLPEVKSVIRSISSEEAEELLKVIEPMTTAKEITHYIDIWTETRFEHLKRI